MRGKFKYYGLYTEALVKCYNAIYFDQLILFDLDVHIIIIT